MSLAEKVTVLVGGYGSGKTQIALNLAEMYRVRGRAVIG